MRFKGLATPSKPMASLWLTGLSVLALAVAACAAPAAPVATGAAPAPAAPAAPAATPTRAPAASDIADAALISAAKAEGSIVLYATPSQLALQADAEGFQKKYGITVNYIRLVAGPLTQRVDTEVKAGRVQADAIMTADTVALDRWSKENVLKKLPEIKYPKTTDYYAPVQIIGQGLVYNTRLVSKADLPKTWSDVLDAKWSGKIAIGNPRIGPGYMTLYYALQADAKYGKGFFTKLAQLKPRVVESDVLVAQSVASGEASMGFTAFPYLAANIKKDSPAAPIDFAYLDIATVLPTNIALVTQAPHANAADLFVRWMMSSEGQKAHNGDGRASSPLGDLEGTLPMPPQDKSRVIPAQDVAKEQRNIIAMFDEMFK